MRRIREAVNKRRMVFFKAFAALSFMAILVGVSILIMAKGSGLIAFVPIIVTTAVGICAFAKYGCLDQH